jgi:hypothetical protein
MWKIEVSGSDAVLQANLVVPSPSTAFITTLLLQDRGRVFNTIIIAVVMTWLTQ